MGERVRAAYVAKRAELVGIDVRQDLAHDDPFLEAVEQQAVAVGRMVAQQARAEAVERRDPRLAVVVLQALVDASRDLPRGAVREGQDEDALATGEATAHRLLVKVDQRVRLSRARPGQHTQWSIHFLDVEWQRGLP